MYLRSKGESCGYAFNTFNTNYKINYFPTVYMICPNRTITEVNQLTYGDLDGAKGNCPPPASSPNDAALLALNQNSTEICNSTPLIVTLQNNGTSPLTSCVISVNAGATQIATYSWSGNLAMYATKVLTVTSVSPTVTTDYDVVITSTDADASNNVQTFTINKRLVNKKNIKIEIFTDAYGTETTWKLFSSAGVIVAQGGPYTNYPNAGEYAQTSYEADLADDCYKFEIYDSYGDGMVSGAGIGYYKVYSNNVAIFNGGDFASVDMKKFDLIHEDDVTGITELNLENGILVYPNPISNEAKVVFELKKETNVKISVQNMLGQTVYSSDLGKVDRGVNSHSIDASAMPNGLYFVTVNMGTEKITKKITVNK